MEFESKLYKIKCEKCKENIATAIVNKNYLCQSCWYINNNPPKEKKGDKK